jgi:ATP-dependent helicase/nuclease subunit B
MYLRSRPDRSQFHRLLVTLATGAGLGRTARGPGRVRVLSADLARTLDVGHLFVVGLGERSFPRLAAPEPFFDEGERQAFRQAGLEISLLSDRLPDEMLLFYQLVTRARQRLVLSYPAVDEKGQELLPSSFLTAVLDCFRPGAVEVKSQRMLIEDYDTQAPLSPAEYRVQAAERLKAGEPLPGGLLPFLTANLISAARMAHKRLHSKEHGPYDGLLRQPGIIAEVEELFGPERVFSPTALEEYVACPFRFFLDHVLKLEPLEEPSEEIESTERGVVFHRALSRLHRELVQRGVEEPTADVGPLLLEQLTEAVRECAARASPAGQALWRLEGQRLCKRGERYGSDWRKFVEKWQATGIRPRPGQFERGFGLPAEPGEEVAEPLVIRVDGVEVRIGGRIDRVDLAETDDGLVFWIIDYKTGRSGYYTGASLKTFDRLQLTLYALAVERVLLPGHAARPLGLAYWLVTDSGPKVVMPGHPKYQAWFADPHRWAEVRDLLEQVVARLVREIRSGTFPLQPRSEDCTTTCSFGQICRINQARPVGKSWSLSLPVVP